MMKNENVPQPEPYQCGDCGFVGALMEFYISIDQSHEPPKMRCECKKCLGTDIYPVNQELLEGE